MNDLKIIGAGSIAAGEYNLVKVSGAATIKGKAKINELKVAGSIKALDDLIVSTLDVTGSFSIDGNLSGERADIKGSCSIDGKTNILEISVAGSLKTIGEVEAEEVKITGGCNIESMNVGNLCIKSINYKIQELHADKIEIIPEILKMKSFFGLNSGYIGVCECTEIEAHNLKCDRLYLTNGKIGPKCVIEYLEYSGVVDVHVDAIVKQLVKAEVNK